MKLSEDLKRWRAERPDEWTMDRFVKMAEELEISDNTKYLQCKHNNIVAWGPDADKCTDCGLTFKV